jgi:hypothetical protein
MASGARKQRRATGRDDVILINPSPLTPMAPINTHFGKAESRQGKS